MNLILASASPRRAALLKEAGYAFVVRPADIDEESYLQKLPPARLASVLASVKAGKIAEDAPEEVTLAADTVIAFDDVALGKPADEKEARDMLQLLSGATHIVITGVAVRCPGRKIDLTDTALSAVRMSYLAPEEIDAYIISGRWQGKAGGYGIQDADPIVKCVGGSISNVIGLPMQETRRLLEKAGVRPVPRTSDNLPSGQGGDPGV